MLWFLQEVRQQQLISPVQLELWNIQVAGSEDVGTGWVIIVLKGL